MSNVSVENLKDKFNKIESKKQELKENKIKLESEINSLSKEYNKTLNELKEMTGKDTYEEIVEFIKTKKDNLEKVKEKVNAELDRYINTEDKNDTNNNYEEPAIFSI